MLLLSLTAHDLRIIRDALVIAQLAHRADPDDTRRRPYADLWDRIGVALQVNGADRRSRSRADLDATSAAHRTDHA
jgi:hypothetical protein